MSKFDKDIDAARDAADEAWELVKELTHQRQVLDRQISNAKGVHGNAIKVLQRLRDMKRVEEDPHVFSVNNLTLVDGE